MILGEIAGVSVEVYASREGDNVDLEVRLVSNRGQEAASGRQVVWAILIDTSKSMKEMDKLMYAVDAAKRLIDNMAEADMVSVYTFDDDVKVVIPLTDAEHAKKQIGKLDKIKVGSYTRLYEALVRVLEDISKGQKTLFKKREVPEEAQKVVVVITDGEPWPTYTEERYYEALGRSAFKRGILINAIGIGEDYNEKILYKLTSAAGGAWYHINKLVDIGEVMMKEFARSKSTALRRPKVVIKPHSCEVLDAKRLGRTLMALGATTEVELPDLASGEVASALFRLRASPGWSVEVRVEAEEGAVEGVVDEKATEESRDKTATYMQTLTQSLLEIAEGGVIKVEVFKAIAETEEAPEHLKAKAKAILEKAQAADVKELMQEATTVIYPTTTITAAPPQPPPPPTETVQVVKAKCVVKCLETGKEIEVEAPAALGREDLAPILPEDKIRYISRKREGRAQLQIEVRPDGVYVRDAGSSGGTYVGGHKAVDWVKITPDDVVNLAKVSNIKIICQAQ